MKLVAPADYVCFDSIVLDDRAIRSSEASKILLHAMQAQSDYPPCTLKAPPKRHRASEKLEIRELPMTQCLRSIHRH